MSKDIEKEEFFDKFLRDIEYHLRNSTSPHKNHYKLSILKILNPLRLFRFMVGNKYIYMYLFWFTVFFASIFVWFLPLFHSFWFDIGMVCLGAIFFFTMENALVTKTRDVKVLDFFKNIDLFIKKEMVRREIIVEFEETEQNLFLEFYELTSQNEKNKIYQTWFDHRNFSIDDIQDFGVRLEDLLKKYNSNDNRETLHINNQLTKADVLNSIFVHDKAEDKTKNLKEIFGLTDNKTHNNHCSVKLYDYKRGTHNTKLANSLGNILSVNSFIVTSIFWTTLIILFCGSFYKISNTVKNQYSYHETINAHIKDHKFEKTPSIQRIRTLVISQKSKGENTDKLKDVTVEKECIMPDSETFFVKYTIDSSFDVQYAYTYDIEGELIKSQASNSFEDGNSFIDNYCEALKK